MTDTPYPHLGAEFERLYVKPKFGNTLIVGSYVTEGKEDRRLRYEDRTVVGVDMRPGPGVDVVHDMQEWSPHFPNGITAHIECMSVLEHVKKPWLMASYLESMLEPGGTIHIVVPFVWAYHGYPHDYWRMTPDGIQVLFPSIEWVKLAYVSFEMDVDVRKQKLKGKHGYNYFPRTEIMGFGFKK